MEKEVSGISEGVSLSTSLNAWLSVITSAGFFPSESSVLLSSVSFTTIAVVPASRRSRIVCCCGRISLPFGAAESIGTTSTMKSPGVTRSRTINLEDSSAGTKVPRRSFNSWIWRFSVVLVHRICSKGILYFRWVDTIISWCVCSDTRSALLRTSKRGIFLSCMRVRIALSCGVIPEVPSITSTAMSVLFRTW